MPTIDELVARYLITDQDRPAHPAYPAVRTFAGSWVTPLIDGYEYFEALHTAITGLGDTGERGIFLAAWHLDSAFQFRRRRPGPAAAFPEFDKFDELGELLADKADDGVDVRVLVWVNDFVMGSGFGPVKTPLQLASSHPRIGMATKAGVQRDNLRSIRALRGIRRTRGDGTEYAPLEHRVLANTLDHPKGAAHMKFALVFDGTKAMAFTGGMDPRKDRFSIALHGFPYPVASPERNDWHDVAVGLEGDVTQACHDFFRDLWNELAMRATTPGRSPEFLIDDEVVVGTPQASTLIPTRTLPAAPDLAGGLLRVQSLRTMPSQRDAWLVGAAEATAEFAPDGIHEIELALAKAIAGARTYIYVEDQTMEGRLLFGHLRAAVRAVPGLRVVLLTGVTDPGDVATGTRNLVMRAYLTEGLTPSEIARIAFFEHQTAIMHSKVWLVDDVFALVGSANVYNRALFTEIEHSVGLVHTGAVNVCEDLRRRLWGEHFRLAPADRGELFDVQVALKVWNPGWGPSTPPAPSFTLPAFTGDFRAFRRPWGTALPEAEVLSTLPALARMTTPWPGSAGSQEIVVRGGRDFRVIRTADGARRFEAANDPTDVLPEEARLAGTIVDVGDWFIVDSSLPRHGDQDLVGRWVVVWLPDDAYPRKIEAHDGHRIEFEPLPSVPASATLVYALLTPVLMPVTMPPPVTALTALRPDYFWVQDVGEPPL